MAPGPERKRAHKKAKARGRGKELELEKQRTAAFLAQTLSRGEAASAERRVVEDEAETRRKERAAQKLQAKRASKAELLAEARQLLKNKGKVRTLASGAKPTKGAAHVTFAAA